MKNSWIEKGTVLARVGNHHLAFFRGYLEGLDLGRLTKQYLETAGGKDTNLDSARSVLKWIRDQLLMAAKREGNFSKARVILIEPEKLKFDPQVQLPSIDEFREERDPYEMYSESELLEMFQEQFGGSDGKINRKAARNERLRKKQVEAVKYFQHLLGADPVLDDPVHGWLDKFLADRLVKLDLISLKELIDYINLHGYRWWRNIPRVGEKAATQIVTWLNNPEVQKSLGIPVGKRALTKSSTHKLVPITELRKSEFGIVPMEFLVIPSQFDGSNGENRCAHNWIKCSNDYEAIQKWLMLKTNGSNTWRSYRKEAERLILFAILERQKPFSSLDIDDCLAYSDFLNDMAPTRDGREVYWKFRLPREHWLAPRYFDRTSTLWRPFEGPLAKDTIAQALTVVRSMFGWLTEMGYLEYNPWKGVPRAKQNQKVKVNRSFTKLQWRHLMQFLENSDHDEKYDRLRFILVFLYGTGLRLSELVNAKISDIERIQDINIGLESKLELKVIGKGNFERMVALPHKLLNELNRYLKQRGLSDRHSCNPDTYFVGRLRKKSVSKSLVIDDQTQIILQSNQTKDNKIVTKDITESGIYQILKSFFKASSGPLLTQANEAQESGDVELANNLRYMANHLQQASTHWMRHTCGIHALNGGVSLQSVQTNYGHKSLNTTTMYVTPEANQRGVEFDNFINEAFNLSK